MYKVNINNYIIVTIKAKTSITALKRALRREGFDAEITEDREYQGIAVVTNMETLVEEEFKLKYIKWVG